MPLIFQHRIYRRDLQANAICRYVFGDNVQRLGRGGQAAEMRDEPNAIGIATKWKPTMGSDAFFSDERFEEQKEILYQDFVPVVKYLRRGGIVIWPLDGIGTGLSEVPIRSPKTWELMQRLMQKLGEIG